MIGISSFSVLEICFGHFGKGREEGGSLGVVMGEVLFRLLILISDVGIDFVFISITFVCDMCGYISVLSNPPPPPPPRLSCFPD